MTVETQEVTQRTVGYSWSVSVEVEHREETGAKYPDKTVTKIGLGGHTDDKGSAVAEAGDAVSQARELTK